MIRYMAPWHRKRKSKVTNRRSPRLTLLSPWLILVSLFLVTWVLMMWAEPDSDLVKPENYYWYFLVTTFTVGYGDYFPKTGYGHLIALPILFGGIVFISILIAQLQGWLSDLRTQRMKGIIPVDATDHFLIVGYTAERTRIIVDHIRHEVAGAVIVICDTEARTPSHPMPELANDGVYFVRGNLKSKDLVAKAAVTAARVVLIDVVSDDETLAIATMWNHLAPAVRIVATLSDLGQSELMRMVGNDCVEPVAWGIVHLVAKAMLHRDANALFQDLLTPGGTDFKGLDLPAVWPRCSVDLLRDVLRLQAATLLSHAGTVNPLPETPTRAGEVILYMANHALDPRRLVQDVSELLAKLPA